MNTYVIRRRNGWNNAAELEKTGAVSNDVSAEMSDKVRWIRTYVVTEEDGTPWVDCICQGVIDKTIREHARRVDMPADEIVPVADTLVVNADPEPATMKR